MKDKSFRISFPLLLGSLLTGCALIELPFKLLGSVFQVIVGLLQTLINVGSSAAVQVAKFTPIALLFTQAAPAQKPTGDESLAIERLAEALQEAPLEITTLIAASTDAPPSGSELFLLDPASLLTEDGRNTIVESLKGREIVRVRWVAAESATSLPPPSPIAWAR